MACRLSCRDRLPSMPLLDRANSTLITRSSNSCWLSSSCVCNAFDRIPHKMFAHSVRRDDV